MEYGALSMLVVDDDPVNRAAVVRLLKMLGVGRVMEASDGGEALARCDRLRFDAILCDVEMRPVDGLAFVQELRARDGSPCVDAPVMMLTRHSGMDVVLNARECGANAYMVKPVTRETLAEKLSRLLSGGAAAVAD